MAMTADQILKKAQDVMVSSETMRLCYEAKCGLDLAYAYGSQWASIGRGHSGGQNLQQLRTITSANRSDVRVAMNLIGPRIVKLDSRLKLRELEFHAVPATRSIDDLIAARVGDARLKHHLRDANGKRKLRRASLWRLVIGSVVVRRSIAAHGKAVEVFDADGKKSINPITKQPRRLRKFRHSWEVCAPYEFIRDPAATTLDFDDEDIIGQEKPWTTERLQRVYGVKVETETTMGQLLEFQRFLYRATGHTMNRGFSMSMAKGVMVSEWFLKDPEGNDEWDTWALMYRDTRGDADGGKKLRIIKFGPNPYVGLPFHHFWYNPKILSPWGQSVPEITMQAQDATNIAYSMGLRSMIHHASPKFLVEQNSLVDKIQDALSNRTDVPIVYRKGHKPPERLQAALVSPEIERIMAQAPRWLDEILNMSPIQQGISSPRGEAGKALEIKRDAADTPLTAISDEDEITNNELLAGTLHDISKTDSLKTLQDDLGGRFTFDQIALFKSMDTRKAISGVQVQPDSMRPRTPSEMRADALESVNSQMVDATTARRTLMVKGRIVLDVKEGLAYHNQMSEIKTLLDGGEVEVYLGQDHATHMYAIELEQESPEYPLYSDEQRGALQQHWFEHEQMSSVMQRLKAESAQLPADAQGQGEPLEPLPAAVPDQGFGGLEGLGNELGPQTGTEQPAIAGSVGLGNGIATPAAGQALSFG